MIFHNNNDAQCHFSWEVLKCGGNGEMIYAGKLIVPVPQLPVHRNREGHSIIVVVAAVKPHTSAGLFS